MEILVPLLVVFAVFVFLFFAILTVVVKVSSWGELAAAFPSPGSLPAVASYGGCAGRIGRMHFRGQGRGLTIRIFEQGLGVHIGLPMMPDLLIPWSRVESVQELSMLGSHALSISVAEPVPLRVDVPTEALTHLKGRLAEDAFKEPRKIDSLEDIMQLKESRTKGQE
jgi:hypothetical protein